MRIRKRQKIGEIHLLPEDTISLRYNQVVEFPDGRVVSTSEEVLKDEIKRELTLNEAVIFDVEKGDFGGAEDGIGGAFLNTKPK